MPATGTNRSRACDMFRCATPPTNIIDDTITAFTPTTSAGKTCAASTQ